jgi:hypothetical protein
MAIECNGRALEQVEVQPWLTGDHRVVWRGPPPGDAEVLRVAGIDLGQRRVLGVAEVAAVRTPLALLAARTLLRRAKAEAGDEQREQHEHARGWCDPESAACTAARPTTRAYADGHDTEPDWQDCRANEQCGCIG